MANKSVREARLRLAVGWAAVIVVGLIALLATAHVLGDLWTVVSRVSSLAALRVLLTALVAIGIGACWVVVVAWLAGRGPRGTTYAVAAGLVALVAVRLAAAWVYDGVVSGEPGIYDREAAALAAGSCCPWDEPVDRPLGYAFLLAGAYALFGRSAASAEALNLLFALGTGLVVWRLAHGLYGARAGAVALVLYALWPAGALMVGVRMPHLAYDLAFAGTAWTAIAGPRGWKGGALTGVILGLSAYLRPTALGLLPAMALARVWSSGRTKGWFTETLLPLTVAAVLILVPMLAWHAATRGTLDVATSAYGGSSLYHGSNVESDGRWSEAAYQELVAIGGGDRWARSEAGRELAVQRWLDDPLAIAALGVRKQDRLWGTERYGVRYGIRRELASRPYLPKSVLPSLASGVFYAALAGLAAFGLYRRRHETDALGVLILATVVSISLVHAVMEVRDRYHAHLIPLLMPLAAVALGALLDRVAGRRSRTTLGR